MNQANSPRALIILAFAIVYIVWGSTFIAIKFTVAEIPIFQAGAIRFSLAAFLLFFLAWWREGFKFPRRLILGTAISGILLAGLGNGLLLFAEKRVDSGIASLWIATVPIMIQLVNWVAFDRERPTKASALGAFMGILGLLILVNRQSSNSHHEISDILALLGSSLFWSIGTLLQKRLGSGGSPLTMATIQMGAGSVFLFALAAVNGELNFSTLEAASAKSIFALLYLAVMGSVVAFTAYAWLSVTVHPRKASTYALVNPMIALLIGAAIGEQIGISELIAFLAIIIGVALILFMDRGQALRK